MNSDSLLNFNVVVIWLQSRFEMREHHQHRPHSGHFGNENNYNNLAEVGSFGNLSELIHIIKIKERKYLPAHGVIISRYPRLECNLHEVKTDVLVCFGVVLTSWLSNKFI